MSWRPSFRHLKPFLGLLLPRTVGGTRGYTASQSLKMEVVGLTDAEVAKACHEPDPSSQDFMFQQTMFRIKDPSKSLEFYTNVLGMRLLKKMDYPAMSFSLYFMGYAKAEDIPKDEAERKIWCLSQKATLELTHNWGTEKEEGPVYHNGNSEPRGFGHIGVVVPDVYKACERFEKLGVEFVKKPNDGKMKGLAFIKDPDGYWIEILSNKTIS
ncbi:hypothetical protein ScPMuIL_014758 [Solemya velum]